MTGDVGGRYAVNGVDAAGIVGVEDVVDGGGGVDIAKGVHRDDYARNGGVGLAGEAAGLG